MALPTGNLTAHFDASDTDHLWQAWQAGTPYHNTQVTADADVISVWDDEQAADLALTYILTAQRPLWRTTTPLMNLPCADFDGTDDALVFYNEAGTTVKTTAGILTASAHTILVAFYVEAASQNDTADAQNNHSIIASSDGYFGLHYRIDTGQVILQGYHYSSGDKVVEKNISLNTSYVAMLRHESGNLYMSVDGGSESSVAAGDIDVTTGTLRVGRGSGASSFHNGRIGEMACYNAALTGTNLSDAISYFTGKWQAVAGSILLQIINYEGA